MQLFTRKIVFAVNMPQTTKCECLHHPDNNRVQLDSSTDSTVDVLATSMNTALLVASFVWAIFAPKDSTASQETEDAADDLKITNYIEEITRARKIGMSWYAIDKKMDIWWPDNKEHNEEIDEANANIARQLNVRAETQVLYDVLLKRYAIDMVRLLELPEHEELSSEVTQIIKYVSQID